MEKKITVTFSDVDNVEETLKSIFKLLEALIIHYKEKEDNSFNFFLLQITAYIGNVLQMFDIISLDELKDENFPDLEDDDYGNPEDEDPSYPDDLGAQ